MNINFQTLNPYVKQLLGAGVGCLAALVLYQGYLYAEPYLPEMNFWPMTSGETEHASAPDHAKTGAKWKEVTTLTEQMIEDSFEE